MRRGFAAVRVVELGVLDASCEDGVEWCQDVVSLVHFTWELSSGWISRFACEIEVV
jgi:hypothetical protein